MAPQHNVFIAALGIAGAGKSTYLRHRLHQTQIIEMDHCRALACDDPGNQEATADARALLHHLLKIRCRRRILTAVDATNLDPRDRADMLRHANRARMFTVALVFETPERLAKAWNKTRAGTTREVPDWAIDKMVAQFAQTVPTTGPVPGFMQTARISPMGEITVCGLDTPEQFLPAPWLTPVLR